MKTTLLLVICTGLALAEDKPHPAAPTVEQRAAYWRAMFDMKAAQMALAQAGAKLDAIIEDMQKTCGGSEVKTDEKGEPSACRIASKDKK